MQEQQDSTERDLEIKDASLIFNTVWTEMETQFGAGAMHFPKEIFWLNGAPGAGKGTHTEFIMQHKHLTAKPVIVGDLLQGIEFQKIKDAGLMGGDKEVTSLVLRRLLDPDYASGAIVDGYPRTQVQVECIKLFYTKLIEVQAERVRCAQSSLAWYRPKFHIVVLFVDEYESIERQLKRGRRAQRHNSSVRSSGTGSFREVRATDINEAAARKRYLIFKTETYSSLQSLRDVFPYHFINAHGTIREVQARIIKELAYQSSLELAQDTYKRLSPIPIASQIVKHARQELVKRLDAYALEHPEFLEKVITIIQEKFMPIVKKHAISGLALINSENEIFDEALALPMLIDIFSERGYHAVVDVRRHNVPICVDPVTHAIHSISKRTYRFHISFRGSEIRLVP